MAGEIGLEEAGTPLVRLHKRTPITTSTVAPRNAPITPPTSATLLLLLLLLLALTLPVPLGLSLASLSTDFDRILITLSNDDCLAKILSSDRERSASTDRTDATERLLRA